MRRHSAYKAFFAAIFSILGFSAHAVPSYTILDLGTLAGATSRGNGVIDSGQVTGRAQAIYDPMTGGYFSHAFVWDKASGMTDLGPLGLGSGRSSGNGINDSGMVTGSYSVSSPLGDVGHAYVWDAVNGVIDIGTLGGLSSVGIAVNDIGQVA